MSKGTIVSVGSPALQFERSMSTSDVTIISMGSPTLQFEWRMVVSKGTIVSMDSPTRRFEARTATIEGMVISVETPTLRFGLGIVNLHKLAHPSVRRGLGFLGEAISCGLEFGVTDSPTLLCCFHVEALRWRGSLGTYRATRAWSQRVVSTRILRRLQRPVAHQSRLQWIYPRARF